MKKTGMIGLLALMVMGLVSAGVVSAFGGFRQGLQDEDTQTAIANDDYEAWREAVIETLTEERFDELVERHNEMAEHEAKMDAVLEALENDDYEAYLEAIEEMDSNRPVIDEEGFEELVAIHNQRLSEGYDGSEIYGQHSPRNNPGFFGKIRGVFE